MLVVQQGNRKIGRNNHFVKIVKINVNVTTFLSC